MSRRWKTTQFVLGVEGLALMRGWLTGDPQAAEERVREIEGLCRRFHDPAPEEVIEVDDVEISRGYDDLATTYDRADNALLVAEQPAVRLHLDRLPLGRVADVACGTGRHTEHLVALGHEVVGVDISPAMLTVARKRAPQARLVRGHLEALPLRTDRYDAAVCALALTHLPRLQQAVSELARVVRPGGSVILSDIHPFAAATGAHVPVKTASGRVALVRNHFHPHSRYLEAFSDAGLVVMACLEPTWETSLYSRSALQALPEATAMALDGLPFALIWHLTVAP